MTEISKEYAEALFSIACENGEERTVMAALNEAMEAFRQNPEYMDFLSSPGIPLSERLSAVDGAFLGRLPEDVVSFIGLLCEKRRILSFPQCVEEYQRLLNIREAVVAAKVISAVELTDAEKAALKQKLQQISGNTVVPEYTVDPAILGGVIVEMNGRVMDGSLRHRLREIKDVMNR